VLQKGHIDPNSPTLVRMHALSVFDDIFGAASSPTGMLAESMKIIGEEGAGLVVMIPQTGRTFLSTQVKRLLGEKPPKAVAIDHATNEAESSGMPDQLRNYGVGAQILADLGVQDMELLSNSSHELVGLDAYGLHIVGQRAVPLGG